MKNSQLVGFFPVGSRLLPIIFVFSYFCRVLVHRLLVCLFQLRNLQYSCYTFSEEWKRRYEKEKEKNAKLRAVIQHLEKELARWRNGESVPVHERFSSLKDQKPIETAQVPASPAVVQSSAAPVTVIKNELSEEERKVFDEERSKLYTQLDERVCFALIRALRLNLRSLLSSSVSSFECCSQVDCTFTGFSLPIL